MSEFESRGRRGGVGSVAVLGGEDTRLSENMKNSDRSEMYSFTMSKAIARHCEGERRAPPPVFGLYMRTQ